MTKISGDSRLSAPSWDVKTGGSPVKITTSLIIWSNSWWWSIQLGFFRPLERGTCVMHVVGSCLGWIVDTVYTCLETSMLLIKSAGNTYFICPSTIKYPLHMGMGPAPLKKPPLWSHAMPCCGVVLEAEDPRTELLLEISLVVKRQVRLRNGRSSLRGSQMRSMSYAKLTSFVDGGS